MRSITARALAGLAAVLVAFTALFGAGGSAMAAPVDSAAPSRRTAEGAEGRH
ncbi:hypothetical protein [Calidifontibacter indicus]|uniref:hypothetical protein n=1 Tax=Calidifontibacter indicus TaxID=419650 RepID=UPI003D74D5C1